MDILKIVFILIILHGILCEDANTVLRMISATFGNTILECRNEVPFGQEVIDRFLRFWETEEPLEMKEMGCVTFCAISKLQLIDVGGALRIDNAKGFAKANYADEAITERLISIYQECHASIDFSEICSAGLSLAKCFREKVFLLNWVPKAGVQYDDDF